jgi:hypothetical protein
MNIRNIITAVINILLASVVFSFISLYSSVTVYGSTSLLVQQDTVTLDGSVYSEEAEYYQYCLNQLGYTDSENKKLDADGYFGNISRQALAKFLKAQNFSSFTKVAKDKLMSLAENTSNKPFDSGFTTGRNKLTPVSFVYTSLSNINNSDNPFYSMSVLKEFPYIVTSKPSELTYKSMRVAEVIKKQIKLFGYVNLGADNPYDDKSQWRQADLNKVKDEIDNIAAAGWYGIFIDQFGYEWNETRERQNIIVDYAHSKGLKCMVNAWFVEDALGSEKDSTHNPNGDSTHLNSNDWLLVESFLTDGDSYRGNGSYIEKYLKIKKYKEISKINITVLSYKNENMNWKEAEEDIKMSYILSQCLGFQGWWFGKTDNEDYLLYGKEPNINLGTITKQLTLENGNKYTAETDKYIIEYYAEETPKLNLIKK